MKKVERPTDVSIDLETLSNDFDAAILSIGAVAFNRHTGETGPNYYTETNIDDALRHGRVTGSTLAWWVSQDEKARQVFKPSQKKVMVADALRGLNDFLRTLPAGIKVWGNGSSFDITILERHLSRLGMAPEWKYTMVRDMRTLVDASNYDVHKHPRTGVHHNALDDARFQAEVMAKCFTLIGGRGVPSTPAQIEDDEL